MLCVAEAVQRNQTSAFAVGQVPVCCELVVAPTVLTLNVPVPEIAVALAQSFAPCANAEAAERVRRIGKKTNRARLRGVACCMSWGSK